MQEQISFCDYISKGDFDGLLDKIDKLYPKLEGKETDYIASPAMQIKMLIADFPEAVADYLAKIEIALGSEQTNTLIHLCLNSNIEEAITIIDASNCDELEGFRYLLSQAALTKD